jgi:ABC-type lipoprotein export system ATPase subunit
MLYLKDITKSYLQRGMVLNNLSLDVVKGDTIAITGPSGSGKTTLMNLIGGLDRPDSGEIMFENSSILAYSPDEAAGYRNRNIGFVFQDHLLLPHLTVAENIRLPLLASSLRGTETEEKEMYITELLEKTGISELVGKYPFQISGGEAQRVTLVRALVNKPSLLLADEPTGSLDSANALLMGDLLLQMNRSYGLTILLVTHSNDLAARMSTRFILKNGKLISFEEDKTKDL